MLRVVTGARTMCHRKARRVKGFKEEGRGGEQCSLEIPGGGGGARD